MVTARAKKLFSDNKQEATKAAIVYDELEPFTITGEPKAESKPASQRFGVRKNNGGKAIGLFGKASADRNLFKRSDINKVIINVKMY